MTVAELIEKLKQLPPGLEVKAGDDDELNGVHDVFDPEIFFLAGHDGLYAAGDAALEDYSEEELTKVVVL